MRTIWSSVGVTALSIALLSAPAAVGDSGHARAAAVPTTTATSAVASTNVSPVGYTDRLIRAWGSGDRPRVDSLATAAVAGALFAYSTPGGVSWRRTGSEGAAGTIYVIYHDDLRGGNVTVGVSDILLGQGQAHAAYTVRFSQAHPLSSAGYADRLVRAWGRGDRAAVLVYAAPAVQRALFSLADPGGGHWRRVSTQGAAGTTYVTYHDDAHGGHLTVAVDNAAVQDARRQAVREVRFTA